MTFDSRERSADQGRPVEFYTFARDYQTWRYTSADRDIDISGALFKARAISRSAIETSAEKARSGITLTVPRDLEVAELYRVSPPTLAITCVVQQYHDGDGQLATLWTGRIAGVEWVSDVAAQIALEPVSTGMRRIGLRRLYQRQCPHVLYSAACGVNREVFRTNGTVDAVSGLVVSVPEADLLADGWFAGGFLEFAVELGISERRFITDHAGANLTLSTSPYGLDVGAEVKLYPGCEHIIGVCDSKFSNAVNFGGMPYFTKKNPFDGNPVF